MIRFSRASSLMLTCLTALAAGEVNVLAEDCTNPQYGATIAFGGAETDYVFGLAVGTDGCVVLCGYFHDVVDFDPGPGEDFHSSVGEFHDAFVTKFNPDGSYAWTWTAVGDGANFTEDVTIDAEGSVYGVGAFSDDVDFDPTKNADVRTANGSYDFFITKILADGTYAWTVTIGGDSSDEANAVGIGANGDVVVTGTYRSWVDFDPSEEGIDSHSSDEGSHDVYVTRLTSDGGYQWTIVFGGDDADFANDMVITEDDFILLAGGFVSAVVDFDPSDGVDEHTSIGLSDAFVTKLGKDGSYVWTRTFGGTSGESVSSLEVDLLGDILLSGGFSDDSPVDFDPTEGVDERVSNGEGDAYVTKLTSDGAYGWTWTAGSVDSDFAVNVSVDSLGNVFVVGSFGDSTSGDYWVDFDQVGAGDVHQSSGEADAFVTLLLSDGSYAWTRTLGGLDTDVGTQLVVDPNLGLLVAGQFSGVVDFDPDGAGDVHVSNGGKDVFLTTFECPDEIACEGDANADGLVDPLDAGFVLSRFGCDVGSGDPNCDVADMNGDGLVDPLDVGYVLARFGTCK